MSDVQIGSYEIVDGWFNIEMKDLAPEGLKDAPQAQGEPKEPPAAAQPKPQKLYEFDESKLIELDPIDDAMLEETDDIFKILNDLF